MYGYGTKGRNSSHCQYLIDDLPIKGPVSLYLDENGKPEVLQENPGIRRFIWEHAQDVH